ncbi:MAG: alkaline shock response membrane anchor protein AmaP [Candidatus Omnitrophica bacterium]|nr:alkaline shock response membrane anchor protein AmaP [Candidatus Omnitrophota bacterium]
MGFFSALIYILVSFFTGGMLILISINYLQAVEFESILSLVQTMPNLRIVIGLLGLLIVLMCIRTIQNSIAKSQREKTIAFEGSCGQVSISLSAVEDMIKKLLLEFKELKDVKPHVTASKKGLQVTLRIVLSSYTNIPEFTAKIQNVVSAKLQSMLGLEEEIQIKVEIKKILYPETKVKEKTSDEDEGPNVPYRQYQT